jgi:hypothetical protein
LTAMELALSLNWNSTTCVVYIMTGALLANIDVAHCPKLLETRKRPVKRMISIKVPRAFLVTNITSEMCEYQLGQVRVLCDGSVNSRDETGLHVLVARATPVLWDAREGDASANVHPQ